jgi:hypothetical protein
MWIALEAVRTGTVYDAIHWREQSEQEASPNRRVDVIGIRPQETTPLRLHDGRTQFTSIDSYAALDLS